jgi:hypothetical protein
MPGRNALVLETADPWEFIELFGELRAHPAQECALRRAARMTAQQYTWPQIIERNLLPRLRFLATRRSPDTGSTLEPIDLLEAIGWDAPSRREWRWL